MKKLLLLIMLLPTLVFGRKFYFSSVSGNDAYTTAQAQNPNTPWKTLSKLNSLSGIAAAGDTFAFKRGEVFASGNQYTTTGSVKWYGGGYEGRNFPSGTAQNPIVFTYYGDMNLERPNLLYPTPTTVVGNQRNVLAFANVSYIIIDGIQFNDTRFPVNDKRSGAYTCAGLWFGDSGYCGTSEGCRCFNITVKNCNFSNIVYGIVCFTRSFEISNNTFSNFKSTGVLSDTLGNADIGADPMILSGSKFRIINNRITGSWAYANPNSSSGGLLGGALETINDFDSSFIAYNTFIDCSGGMEFGTNQPGGTKGPTDDTICYNKFINCSNIAYLNTTGTYATQGKNIRFWNNFFVEGSKSRWSGYECGGDAMGDGQTYTSTGFIYWPPYPINKSTKYPADQNFQNAWRPIASGDHSVQTADTVYDIRNNIFWINNGFYAKYTQAERPKTFYRNNIYHLVSGYQGAVGSFTPTSLGPGTTLATGERIINTKMIVDSSSVYPFNWDMRIASDTSYAAAGGTNVGLTRDFAGNVVSGTPSIGAFQYQAPTSTLQATSTFTTVTCNGGSSTVTVAATGGTPPYTGIGQFVRGAGAYSYIVTDNVGATSTTTGTIPQPTALVATATVGVIACNGGTTTIVVSATGGTPPYTGTGTFTRSAGPYSYTVTDANNCTNTITGTLSQPTLLNAAVAIGTITVYGGTTSVTVTAAGGTPPYLYKIDGGNFQSNNVITGVPAGGHTITTKDANSCTSDTPITVTQPGPVNYRSRLVFVNAQ